MYASEMFLQVLVTAAWIVTVIAPILFIVLLIRDWKGGRLW